MEEEKPFRRQKEGRNGRELKEESTSKKKGANCISGCITLLMRIVFESQCRSRTAAQAPIWDSRSMFCQESFLGGV